MVMISTTFPACEQSGEAIGVLEISDDWQAPPSVVRDQYGSTWLLTTYYLSSRDSYQNLRYVRVAAGEATLTVRE